ncbi:MFS general substrate transporter [Lindgomyces ingoldianus]|uniref:MFS general substrate transporter n=1 Tax=Lindgomyces ingoldianus TaxID=673940 RepID=A0ACB6QCY3_9PLEO|nr:MFS general substrate transporter [Lindgomyces ingoldianus]KAF2464808.1 MFS general substrate transporter [Lindgomyces ingoldianus]
MTTEFNSLNDIGWYGSAYLLTLMALQPLYGQIYTFFDTKNTFLASLIFFEIGSTVCATAPSSIVFIVGRALSGSGAAGILSGALTLGGRLVPLVKRPLYMSVIMSMYGVAAVAGPTLGGVFTDSHALTWRFCFYLNLPCGGVAFILCIFLLKSYAAPHGAGMSILAKLANIDFVGVVLSIIASVLLFLALKWGGIDYPWNSSLVTGCLVGSVVCFAIFVTTQVQQKKRALISLNVLTQRTVFFGSLFVCFINMAIDTHIYYLPLYFQSVDGATASMSGVRILPYLATMIVTATVSGFCISKLGHYVPFMMAGSTLFTIGAGLIHTLAVGSGAAQWVGYQLLAGIGFGMAFQIPYSALHVVLDAKDLPTGNALIVFFQALGGALAVSIAQNVLSNELLVRLETTILAHDALAIIAAGPTHIAEAVPGPFVDIVVEAYSYAISKTFILPIAAAGMSFLCSLGMEYKKIKKLEK